MKLQSLYKNQLINNLKLFNIVLGLSSIGNPSIQEFLEKSLISYQKICKSPENKRKTVSTLMELCSDVMVLSEDCSFYNIGLVDFSAYERIDFLLDKVLKFSSVNNVREFFKDDFIETVGYMMAIESNLGNNIKQSSSYIVVRNFLTLCHLGMYRFAYYYAVFIRCQIFISEGLSPRIEYSDLYKSELSLAIQKERIKFSKNLKKKISDSIIDTVNKVPLVNVESKGDYVGSSLVVGEGKSVNSSSPGSIDSKVNSFVDNYRNSDSKNNDSKVVIPNNTPNGLKLDLDKINYSEEVVSPKEGVAAKEEEEVVNNRTAYKGTNNGTIHKARKTSSSRTLDNLRSRFNNSDKKNNASGANNSFNEELNKSISSVDKLRLSKREASQGDRGNVNQPNIKEASQGNSTAKVNRSNKPNHSVDSRVSPNKANHSVGNKHSVTGNTSVTDNANSGNNTGSSPSQQRSFTKARIRRVVNESISNNANNKYNNSSDKSYNSSANVNAYSENVNNTKDKDLNKNGSNLSDMSKSSFFS